MESLAETALGLAETGIPVFPLTVDKVPCHRGWRETVSTDPDTVRRLFADPRARLVGVPTGPASGMDVLDIDPRNGGDVWLRANEHRLPPTIRHHTRSGGVHLLFQHAPGVTNSAGTVAPGVDIRGAYPGFVVWWPVHGFHAAGDTRAEWPEDLLLEILRRQERVRAEAMSPEDLAPPDAESLLALIQGMPNPAETTRDEYTAVNLAIQGCIRGLEGLGREVDPEQVHEAAVDWITRWEGNEVDPAFELTKWRDDWSQRDTDKAGWRHLLGRARKLGAEVLRFDMAAAQADFGDPLPPAPKFVAPDLFYSFDRDHDPYGEDHWLVYEMLPLAGVAFLAGQSTAGKTFIAFDLSYSVMTGAQFAGVEVDRQGGVLFLAAEGEREVHRRMTAVLQERGTDEVRRLPLIWQREDVPLMLSHGGQEKLMALVRNADARFKAEGTELVLIVVDTLAQAAGWTDENESAEAQAAIRVMRAWSRETGALVLAVDHVGKDQNAGIRGSTAKTAGADAVLTVLCDKAINGATTNRRMAQFKTRGGASGREFPFALKSAAVGVDAKGRDITSCSVDWQGDAPPQTAAQACVLRGNILAFYNLFASEIDKAGGVATAEALCQVCDEARISNAMERKLRTREFTRAKQKLIDLDRIREGAGLVWVIGSAYDDFNDALLPCDDITQ